MFFSIIIPVYNVEHYIERCLLSVINQANTDVEVILVDDCGQDNSMEVVRRIVETHPNGTVVRIVKHAQNSGPSAARNTGLSAAQGTYVWFVDSDDWIADNCLQRISDELQKKQLDICMISAADCFEGQCIQRFSYPESVGNIVEGKSFIKNRKIQMCTPFSIYKRTFLSENQLQFMRGINYSEDNEFALKCYYLAKNVSYIDEIFYFYFSNPTSLTQTLNPKIVFDKLIVADSLFDFSKIHVEKKHKPFFYNYISLSINDALHQFYKISDLSVQKEWENQFFKKKHLINSLIKSSLFKYRLEGYLFQMFKHSISMYKFLQLFNKRTKKNVLSN